MLTKPSLPGYPETTTTNTTAARARAVSSRNHGAEILKQIRADMRLKRTIIVIASADARMGEMFTDIADFMLTKLFSFTQMRDLTARSHKI